MVLPFYFFKEDRTITIEHDTITDPEIHEPKGASTATSGDMYVSDGAGSGSWIKPEPKGADAAALREMYVSDGAGSGSWQRSTMSDHGEMTITNNSTATAVTAATDATLNTDADYVKITAGWGNPHGHGVAFNTDELVVGVSGHYDIGFWSSINIPLNNNFIGVKYAVNDTAPYSLQKMVSQSATTSDYRTMSGHGGVDLTAGDTISVYLAATKTDSIVVEEAGLSLHLIHE